MKQEPSYYAIIPATVRYDQGLKANEKLMYGEITAMSNLKGYCWAENRYFAELYGVHKKTVSGWITNLSDRGYIRIELEYSNNSKQVKRRKIFIMDTPGNEKMDRGGNEKMDTPGNEKMEEVLNTTSSNNTSVEEKQSRDFTNVKYNDTHLKLAKVLWSYVSKNFPKAKEPNFDNWADDIRLMFEQDDLTELEVSNAIKWSQNNKFWKVNIRSANKLRKQYEELYAQATREKVYFDVDKSKKKKVEKVKGETDFEELQRLLNGE